MNLIQRFLIPLLIALSVLMYALAIRMEADAGLAVLIASLLTIATAFIIERVLPYREQWTQNHGDVATDLVSAGIIVGLADPLLKAFAPVVVIAFYSGLGVTPLISGFPLWIEILFVLVVVEFGKYWAHRLHHKVSALWWLHAMHHSSERLYFLNGLRFHPANYMINFLIAVLPVMLLGVSAGAMLGYLAITQPIVLIQHANIDLRHGWLNKWISTPEVHRWHHSTTPDEANRNYGNALLIWDHVFGTYKAAEGFAEDKQIGLFESSRVSYPGRSGYLTQLLSMFRPPCCRVG